MLGERLYAYRPNPDIEEDLGIDDDACIMVFQRRKWRKSFGKKKTYARVARYYYWPKYYQSVKEHVSLRSLKRACLPSMPAVQGRT